MKVNFIKELPNNPYILLAGTLSIFISPSLDAIGLPNVYAYAGILFVVLFLVGIYEEYKKSRRFERELIHFPIVIKLDDGPNEKYAMDLLVWKIEELDKELTNYKQSLLNYFHLDVESYIFTYKGNLFDKAELFSFLKIIRYKLDEVENRLQGRVKFHVAYYRRPAVGFMVGSLFRTESIVVYQNNDAKNIFEQVCDVNSRVYKERVENFTYYSVEECFVDTNDQEVLVVINSASHKVNLSIPSLLRFQNKVVITLNKNGTIPYEENWCQYSAEIYTVFNQLQTKFKKMTVAHAMPEAIAILLGMAMENYWDVCITQYTNQDYIPVFNLKEVSL